MGQNTKPIGGFPVVLFVDKQLEEEGEGGELNREFF
jgi:hypothetical protein